MDNRQFFYFLCRRLCIRDSEIDNNISFFFYHSLVDFISCCCFLSSVPLSRIKIAMSTALSGYKYIDTRLYSFSSGFNAGLINIFTWNFFSLPSSFMCLGEARTRRERREATIQNTRRASHVTTYYIYIVELNESSTRLWGNAWNFTDC